MARKIVQIAVSVQSWPNEDGADNEETLYALADDGTVWYTLGKSPTLHKGWSRTPLDALPQGEIADNGYARD